MAEIQLKTVKFPGLDDTYVIPSTAGEIQNDSNVSGSTVTDALNALASSSSNGVTFPIGTIGSSSTKQAFVISVDGITELSDGIAFICTNTISGYYTTPTFNVNSLGAKPGYSAIGERVATNRVFCNTQTCMFVYNSSRVTGGCWDIYELRNYPRVIVSGSNGCTSSSSTSSQGVVSYSVSLATNGSIYLNDGCENTGTVTYDEDWQWSYLPDSGRYYIYDNRVTPEPSVNLYGTNLCFVREGNTMYSQEYHNGYLQIVFTENAQYLGCYDYTWTWVTASSDSSSYTAGTGINITEGEISADSSAIASAIAGNGLTTSSGALAVNPGTGLTITNDQVNVNILTSMSTNSDTTVYSSKVIYTAIGNIETLLASI